MAEQYQQRENREDGSEDLESVTSTVARWP